MNLYRILYSMACDGANVQGVEVTDEVQATLDHDARDPYLYIRVGDRTVAIKEDGTFREL